VREFFYPNSVAVVGVSPAPDNLGRNIVQNLIEFDFQGIIYEVGLRGGVFAGRRIYRSMSDIPDQVDLAIIFTPARTIPDILEECGQKGIRRAVIESSGFSEYGPEGRAIEQRALDVARKWNIRFIGPNCIGIINMENGLCAPFTPLKRIVEPGDISLISQSGGVGLSFMNLLASENLGLNKFISAGNMLDAGAPELLSYLIKDKGTRIICLYLEGIHDGRKLMEVAQRSPKPILAIKANIGTLSKDIASSHTVSLSSDNRVVDAAFRQFGIARVRSSAALGSYLKILSLPFMQGDNLAIVSRSGGHAVIAADACEESGFVLPEFPRAFIEEIEKHFRASVIRLTNPLDLGDLFELEMYHHIVEETLRQEGVDGLLLLHIYFSSTEGKESRELMHSIEKLSAQYNKPVAVCVFTDNEELVYLKRHIRYPIFVTPEEAIRALQLSRDYGRELRRVHGGEQIPTYTVERAPVDKLVRRAIEEDRDLLLHEAAAVLGHYGIPMAQGAVARTEAEARECARRIGFPVAIKIISEHISHKSDVGGVQLNLRNENAVKEAFQDMTDRIREAYPDVEIDGLLVQPMVTGGRELILGGRQDDQFGPVVLLGLGGIFVEIFGAVSLRMAPFPRREATAMIEELKGAPILMGTRGQLQSDIDSLVEAILRLSQLLCDFPQIKEIDINPLRVFAEGKGCMALDSRILLEKKRA